MFNRAIKKRTLEYSFKGNAFIKRYASFESNILQQFESADFWKS